MYTPEAAPELRGGLALLLGEVEAESHSLPGPDALVVERLPHVLDLGVGYEALDAAHVRQRSPANLNLNACTQGDP